MTIAFSALLSIVIGEFISLYIGKDYLPLFIIIGTLSVFYWLLFGDLSLYVLIQFYQIAAISIILLFLNIKNKKTIAFWYLLACYVIAKLLEYYDYEVHNTLKYISGHALNHLMVSIGVILFIILYKKNNFNKCPL